MVCYFGISDCLQTLNVNFDRQYWQQYLKKITADTALYYMGTNKNFQLHWNLWLFMIASVDC